MTAEELVEKIRAAHATSRSILDACRVMGEIEELLKLYDATPRPVVVQVVDLGTIYLGPGESK